MGVVANGMDPDVKLLWRLGKLIVMEVKGTVEGERGICARGGGELGGWMRTCCLGML